MKVFEIVLDEKITVKKDIFDRFVKILNLGFNDVEGWDALTDLLMSRLSEAGMRVDVVGLQATKLSAEELAIFSDVVQEINDNSQSKISFVADD